MKDFKKMKFYGVYTDGESLFTKNLVPNYQVYGEELVLWKEEEYRVWNPRRSKASAISSQFKRILKYCI
jgi:fibrillarin-like rRNA methylase